jgi:hypothetical protein
MTDINITEDYILDEIRKGTAKFMSKREVFNHNAASILAAIADQIGVGKANVFSFHCENIEKNPYECVAFVRFKLIE